MKITGSYTFDAPQADVWNLLMDQDAIAGAIPGVESFKAVADNDYEAQLNLGIGAVRGQYTGRVTLSDIQPPSHYRMTIGGKGQRGFVNGEGTVDLEAQGEQTVVRYAGDAHLGGQLAGVAQRLVEGAARTLINRGFRSLENQLAERRAAAAAPAPEVAAPAAAPAELPSAVPSLSPRWLIGAVVGFVLLLWRWLTGRRRR